MVETSAHHRIKALLWTALSLIVCGSLGSSALLNETLTHSTADPTSTFPANSTLTLIPRKANRQKIAIYSILFVISSVGNTTSFIALLFMNRLNRSQNFTRIRMLFMNLCIADLMVTYIHLPLEIIWAYTDAWLAGELMCKLMMFVRTFGLYLSSFIIITITVDRFYVIVKPLELERVYRLNKILIVASWIVSFLSSLPQVYVFEMLTHPNDPTFKQCVTFSKLNTVGRKIIYNSYHFVTCYGLPLLIMIYCYTKIFSTITSHSKSRQRYAGVATGDADNRTGSGKWYRNGRQASKFNNMKRASFKLGNRAGINEDVTSEELSGKKLSVPTQYESKGTPDSENFIPENELIRRNTNHTYLKAKFRTLRLSILIVIAFLFSWTPYYVCVLWAIISPDAFLNPRNKKISSYLFTFAVSNSCFNPIVYGIFSNKLYQFLPCIQNKDEAVRSSQKKPATRTLNRQKGNGSVISKGF